MKLERKQWEQLCQQKLLEHDLGKDPAHDFSHFKRVVESARRLCEEEGGNLDIVLPAAWLHDLINVPKNDPRRSQASRLSAEEAIRCLKEIGYPEEYFDGIRHAIEAHSFSAQIEARTLEARIVQDADRLDGLGAVGVGRCFIVAGALNRPIYHPMDPFAKYRELDDSIYTIDHFFVKLFKTAESLQTESGRREGMRRVVFMKAFLDQLGREIGQFPGSHT